MKKEIKNVALGIVVGLAMAGTISIGSTLVTENVYFNPFKILLNGKEHTTNLPILNYKDSTYVPLRELATLTGSDVGFEDSKIIVDNENQSKYDEFNKSEIYYLEDLLALNGGIEFDSVNDITSDQYLRIAYNVLRMYKGPQEFDIYRQQELDSDEYCFDKSTIEQILKSVYGLTNIEHKTLIEYGIELMKYDGKTYIPYEVFDGADYLEVNLAEAREEDDKYVVIYNLLECYGEGYVHRLEGLYKATIEKDGNAFRILSNEKLFDNER